MYTLELTEEELDFIYDRCTRKAQRLEEANLHDLPCYRLSWQLITKIQDARKETKMDPHTATEVAYTNGFRVGKKSAAEQIFADLDKLHLHVSNEYEARAYEELKKKDGVN
jgi:hypothetical protein